MENLLLLVHRIPYPPNKGDKIRSYHLLRHLAARYRVHLGTFVDSPDDWQYVEKVRDWCTSSHIAKLDPKLARLRSLGALLSGRALSFDYYRDAGMQDWVARTMSEHKIDRVVVFSSPMAQYAMPYAHARRVIDFCDVDSDKWRMYADQKPWPMSWLYRREARTLLDYEREVARACDSALFATEPEAQLFRELAPESDAKIGHFNNGVDTDYFSPAHACASPFAVGERVVVFTGAMDYWPNVDAVEWFTSDIFPRLRERLPALRFYIVGARPTPAVQALGRQPGVVVTGTVPDVRPYLAHAAVSVAPLRVARGIQNKVLEAMAMALPVVVTSDALEGVKAEPGADLLLADGAEAFAAAVLQVLGEDNPGLRNRARERVEQYYSWPSNLANIEASLECN
ncbi:TIGR03087 family PEP-CTERM/XrtA system glycosyltransferase [Massilia yuzhufengensis]|uniref:Sugar transferase, PEP-CTERM/EpsH1 system associated n=1 Tax=Massilia yuzhufengensis TaxID=1164594 RepID=A0A1I1DJX6_9BURK|nr:TIGR03087 family PEP-CTERM/XrtA system glycosyltransferase [Massilia yuzhufengensis]SFB75134.1 sugar transferase, PEP-CTERM/EpsH1 system associated [Massilia yuzhufengensis]